MATIIRIRNNDEDLRPIRLFLHWHVHDETRIVHHIPSKLTFVIDYSPPAAQGWVKASELTARLAHVCDGNAPPPPDRVRRIAKTPYTPFLCSLV